MQLHSMESIKPRLTLYFLCYTVLTLTFFFESQLPLFITTFVLIVSVTHQWKHFKAPWISRRGLIVIQLIISLFFLMTTLIPHHDVKWQLLLFLLTIGADLFYTASLHTRIIQQLTTESNRIKDSKNKLIRDLILKVRNQKIELPKNIIKTETKSLPSRVNHHDVNDEVNKLNQICRALDKELWNKSKELRLQEKNRLIEEKLTYADFTHHFGNANESLKFIAELKWKDGFQCRKCGNKKAMKLKQYYLKKCSRCTTTESVTAYTIFHATKLPLDKALYMVYAYQRDCDLSPSSLSQEIDLRVGSCRLMKNKVLEAKSDFIEMYKTSPSNWTQIISYKAHPGLLS